MSEDVDPWVIIDKLRIQHRDEIHNVWMPLVSELRNTMARTDAEPPGNGMGNESRYEEGIEAQTIGFPQSNCPYAWQSGSWHEWMGGYEHGKRVNSLIVQLGLEKKYNKSQWGAISNALQREWSAGYSAGYEDANPEEER